MINPDDPAYPCMKEIRTGEHFLGAQYIQNMGMTIRTKIAAMCLQGLMAYPNSGGLSDKDYAQSAVMYADALIAELNKEKD